MRARFLSLLLLVASSAYAQLPVGDFSIAPDRLDVVPLIGGPIVAASRDQFLVAWSDRRGGEIGTWAARVSRTGEILDPIGFSLVPQLDFYLRDVASDGTGFLVMSSSNDSVRFDRVDAAGSFTAGAVSMRPPSSMGDLIWTGDSYALFYIEGVWGERLLVQMLDRDGRFLGEPFPVVASTRRISRFAVAAGSRGTGVVVAWSEYGDEAVRTRIFGTAVLRSGEVILAPPASGATSGVQAIVTSVASDGDGYLVTWGSTPAGVGRSYARQLDSSGNAAAPVVELSTDAGLDRLVWNGARYVSPARARDSLIRHRLDGSVERADPLTAPIDSDPALAGLGGRTLIVMRVGAALNVEMDGVRSRLSLAPVDRRDAVAVWRGDHYLAVWREQTDENRTMMGRITPAGQPLDGQGVILGTASTPPRIASDGRHAVVTWNQGSAVRIAFVNYNGRVVTKRDFFSHYTYEPVVHWNGTQYLVVFPRIVAQHLWLVGVRITADGTFLDDEPVLIVERPVTPGAIAGNGAEYALAWVQWPNACALTCRAELWTLSFGSAFLPFGFPSRAATVEVAVGPGPVSQSAQVVGGADGFLLVWSQLNPTSLRGLRVSSRGMALDPFGGFEIAAGDGGPSSLMSTVGGWTVIRGTETWSVGRDGRTTPRTSYPFIPAGSTMSLTLGGPAPLVIYRTPAELGWAMRARFLPSRQRAARR